MPNLPNITREIIAQGYNCHVRAGTNASDAKPIALVSRFQVTQDFQVQEATCLGVLGPVAIDPQGYTCNVALDGFMPYRKLLNNNQQYADGGKISVMEYVPTRAKFMEGEKEQKIAYMDFWNKKAQVVLAAVEGILISNEVITAEGNTYVRYNVQARALQKTA